MNKEETWRMSSTARATQKIAVLTSGENKLSSSKTKKGKSRGKKQEKTSRNVLIWDYSARKLKPARRVRRQMRGFVACHAFLIQPWHDHCPCPRDDEGRFEKIPMIITSPRWHACMHRTFANPSPLCNLCVWPVANHCRPSSHRILEGGEVMDEVVWCFVVVVELGPRLRFPASPHTTMSRISWVWHDGKHGKSR